MPTTQSIYQLILELNKLKLVFRNTSASPARKESSAEHSWSVSMIIMILMDELKREFGKIDEIKSIKMGIIHDIVEIYAGDVSAFDAKGRQDKEQLEIEALEKLIKIYPSFGQQLHDLWHEFEQKETLEAKIAKAADSICPIFLRVQSKLSYIPFQITMAKLEQTKVPHFAFSKTFTTLYQQLKSDLLKENLIEAV